MGKRDQHSDFHEVLTRFRLPLAPVFLTRPQRQRLARHAGEDSEASSSEEDEREDDEGGQQEDGAPGAVDAAQQMLATFVMRYLPSVQGVVLAFTSPHRFISASTLAPLPSSSRHTSAIIPPSVRPTTAFLLPSWTPSAFATMEFETSLLVWKPELLSRLTAYATPTGSSASHLSLLVHGTFNASIPKEELVSKVKKGKAKAGGKKSKAKVHWRWDPDRKVPERWKKTFFNAMPAHLSLDGPEREDGDEQQEEGADRGCWVDANGDILGGGDGRVELTVIKLTVADNMLSVTGSLLSPRAVLKRRRQLAREAPTNATDAPPAVLDEEEEEEEDEEDEIDLMADFEDGEDEFEEGPAPAPPPPAPTAAKRPRKERSDKGKPRKPKVAAPTADASPAQQGDGPGLPDIDEDVKMPPPLGLPPVDGGSKKRKKKGAEAESGGKKRKQAK